jgi:kumamolisin
VHCIYPGSSPQVLCCGGTRFVEARGFRREVVWNDTATRGLATGGGVSDQFARPDWQADLAIASANAQAITGRILPDVAAVAALRDWTFFDAGGTRDLQGGTSAVAPFYAALVALAGQQRRAAGKAPLGFLNDRLYALAAAGGLFNDITEGHNRVLPDGKGYRAQPGFDACTGWGTPRIAELLAALAGLP